MFLIVPLIAILCAAAASAQNQADVLFAQGQAAQRTGRLNEAEQIYRQYTKTYGPRGEVLANLGALLARQDRFDEAIAAYQQALKVAPALTPIHLNLGLAYFKASKHEQALQSFTSFLAKNPGHRQALQLRAIANFETGRYEASAKDYEALLPSPDLTINLGLASAYTQFGDAAKARAALEPLLTRDDSAEAQVLVAQTALLEDKPDEAQAALDKALKINARTPALHYYRGFLHWKRRETEEAIAEWREELKLDTNSFLATFALGGAIAMSATAQGDAKAVAEAEALLRRAITLKPRHAAALYQLAKLLWQSKHKDTMGLLERAVKSDPNHREAHYLLGTVYQSAGRTAEAAREFAAVKRISQEGDRKYQELFDTGK